MKFYQIIEKYFWIFLLTGVLIGLWYPVYNEILLSFVEPILMIMMFFVFLKTDAIQVIKNMKDIKVMIYIACIYMLIIPLMFFFSINLFNPKLAVAILLLTSMPAGVASPTLTDIVKGNIAFSLNIVIVTSLIAPFTVPLLFAVVKITDLAINPFDMFKDLVFIIFIPMVLSQLIKRYFPLRVKKSEHLFTSFNIILLFFLVYAIIGSHRDVIILDAKRLVWYVVFLYIIFALLHIFGYLLGFKQNKETRTAMAISAAYMNNGMAIVLAAIHFDPFILILMILSEIPWNTMLAPFKYVLRYL